VCGGAGEPFAIATDRVVRSGPHAGRVWQVLRCAACGFGWTFPPLRPDEIADHYPAEYLGDVRRAIAEVRSGALQRSRSWRKETEKVRLVERFVRRGSILDVGCGEGRFLWALDPARWRRTGVEMSAETAAQAAAGVPEVRLVHGDIFSGALAPGAFDVVTFWHVLEHLPDTRAVLARAAALLAPDGRVFISLPNLASLQARLFRRHWYGFDDVPRHLFHFSPRALELLLAEAGFALEQHRFFSRIVNFHCLKHSLLNWAGDRFGSRAPYYALKPLLFGFPLIEQLAGRYGMLTTIARKKA
jgi:SAM-dependent methyltransferase